LAAVTAAVLAGWWEPASRPFWVPALVSAWLALGLAHLDASRRRVRALGLAAAAVTTLNLGAVILPRADASGNPYRAVAQHIAAVTATEDLIIVGTDILGPSLAYYGRRPHTTNLFAVFLESRQRHTDPLAELHRRIAQALDREARVFISSDALDLSPGHRAMIDPLPGTFADLLRGGTRRPLLQYQVRGAQRVLYEVRRESDEPA
jgi:hypothetical protein